MLNTHSDQKSSFVTPKAPHLCIKLLGKNFIPIAFVLFSFFYFLGGYGLLDNNEGLYAQIAREMLETGDFLLPKLNGVLYFEKPPLLYWLTALSFKIGGINEFSARFVPAISGFGLLAFMAFFFRKQGQNRLGFLTFFILGTSLGYLAFSRTIIFDVLFTTCLTGALLFLFRLSETKNTKNALSFYAFLALAILAKGLVALVLTSLVWIAYFAVEKRRRALGQQNFSFWLPLHFGGIVLFLFLVVPWHLMASLKEPSFAWFYFINEHVYRFLGLREPHDYYSGPVYYYTYRLLIYFAPWVFLTPLFFLKRKAQNQNVSSKMQIKADTGKNRLVTFLLCWFICIFLFFSFSKAKANYYLVTVMPPLGALLAVMIEQKKSVFFDKIAFRIGQSLLLFISFAFFVVMFLQSSGIYSLVSSDLSKVFWFPGCIGISFFLFCLVYRRLKGAFWPYIPLGSFCSLLLVASSCCLPFYVNTITQKQSVLKAFQNLKLKGQMPPSSYAIYREYENVSSLRFYLSSPLKIVDSLSQDLLFGQTQDTSKEVFINKETFKQQGGYIFVRHNRRGEFLSFFPEAEMIWDDSPDLQNENNISFVPGKLSLYYVSPPPKSSGK